jgi:hypothetical protein
MRFFLLFLIVASIVLLAPGTAGAESTRSIELKAAVVDYYSDRFILTADGNVSAKFSDGTVVRGQTFSMDLKLNRFLIAGNVHVDGPHIHAEGAAFAGYPDLERNYFLTEDATPDRWTYYGLDFTDPHPGRQQPGDAFYFVDVSELKPYIVANSATIFLKNNVEFPVGSRILVLGAYIPTPGYVVNYSSNPNFYQNAFSGATFDIGIPYHGAADALSAFHIRYDPYRGLYTAFDQHFVHNQDYAVFSVDPLTQNQRQFNAILYKRVSPAVETRFFYQLSALSQGLSLPQSSGDYANFAVNARVGKYAVGLNVDQYNNSLLAGAQDMFAANGLRQAGHPFDMTLNVQSYEDEFRLFRYLGVPLKFQYRAGYGYVYDSYGLPVAGTAGFPVTNPDGSVTPGNFQGAVYPTIYQTYLGFTVYTNSMKIAKFTTISAKADKLTQWFSLPHHIVTTDVSSTIAYTPQSIKKPAFLLSYDILNIGDFYASREMQLVAYPPAADTITNEFGTFSGLAAFDGFATSRTLSASMVYTPTPYFALNLTAQYFNVTPRAVPGVGGSAPLQFNADVRVRLSKNILVDVSRSYFFNFADQKWSPQFFIQFSP